MNLDLVAQSHRSQLVVIDVQEKLTAVMPGEQVETVVRNCGILLQAAALLEVPVLHTEQYPAGLGPTVPELAPLLPPEMRIEKTVFSCCAEPKFRRQLTTDRPQIVLGGMEAHICVLQTALALQQSGRTVFVAEDAVLSRKPENKANALARLRHAGVIVSNTESIVFEWLGKAEGEAFKQISRLVR